MQVAVEIEKKLTDTLIQQTSCADLNPLNYCYAINMVYHSSLEPTLTQKKLDTLNFW